jgi:hypothetical protein
MAVDVFPPKSQRDLRLDLFRGVANWAIFLGHIPNTALTWLTIRNYGFSDGADLFVFISGYTAALARNLIAFRPCGGTRSSGRCCSGDRSFRCQNWSAPAWEERGTRPRLPFRRRLRHSLRLSADQWSDDGGCPISKTSSSAPSAARDVRPDFDWDKQQVQRALVIKTRPIKNSESKPCSS